MTIADEVAALRAENDALRAGLGLHANDTQSRDVLFREIARGLLMDDTAVQNVKKFGFEESHVRLDLLINGDTRRLEIPVKKLFTLNIVRGYVAEVCNVALPYEGKQWTKYANYILRAAEQCPGYSRDAETVEWVTAFAQRACTGMTTYARPVTEGAVIYDRILVVRSRRAGLFEASHIGDVLFIRRPDDGISFGQADFMAFVCTQRGTRLSLGELDQRLPSIGFHKGPLAARKGDRVTRVKAVWHSRPGWLRDNDCDLPDAPAMKPHEAKSTAGPCVPLES